MKEAVDFFPSKSIKSTAVITGHTLLRSCGGSAFSSPEEGLPENTSQAFLQTDIKAFCV